MRKITIKSETDKQVEALANENAELLFQNAEQDMSIYSLQDENAELLFRLANLETGGIA